MKMYKGFDKDLKCRDFQYEIGKTYEEPTAELCEKGFHACEYPLDVFGYYAPGDMSRYCEVDLDDVCDKKSNEDSKRCGRKIAVKAEIGIAGLVKAAVEYTMEKAIPENSEHATGKQGAASATGWQGTASATGWQGAASATGWQGAASATGEQGTASATGEQGAASATGWQGTASATGWQGAASATGWQGAASATGTESVAAALGIDSKAKGALGCWIVIAEWERDEEFSWNRKDVQCFKVDGKSVKPDIWYKLKNGELVEVPE
jgi:hypothetical protein